ncbi:MAG: hypothetical protein PUB41_06460 [bacterium]|nr:hypothetical protein [bacterium]
MFAQLRRQIVCQVVQHFTPKLTLVCEIFRNMAENMQAGCAKSFLAHFFGGFSIIFVKNSA